VIFSFKFISRNSDSKRRNQGQIFLRSFLVQRPVGEYNSNDGSDHCTGTTDISDCPYNIYRTSGDIGTYWDRMLSNLGSTVPFLGTPVSALRIACIPALDCSYLRDCL